MAEHRITVVGAGPVGTILAQTLRHNGVPFTWVVRNPLRREQLAAQREFSRSGSSSAHSADIEICAEHAALNPADYCWLVLALKAQQVEPFLLGNPTWPRRQIVVVANGLHTGPFNLGVLFGGGRLDDHGELHCGKLNRLLLGALGELQPAPATLAELAMDLTGAMLTASVEAEIRATMWRKAALNCVVNPLTALLDVRNGELLSMLASPLVEGLLAEAAAVIEAEQVKLPAHPLEMLRRDLRELIEATADNSSSMREDLRAGRETEIARLNLAVAECAKRQGLAAPLNAALGRMVSFLTNRGAL